jgi:hypothetical protein
VLGARTRGRGVAANGYTGDTLRALRVNQAYFEEWRVRGRDIVDLGKSDTIGTTFGTTFFQCQPLVMGSPARKRFGYLPVSDD